MTVAVFLDTNILLYSISDQPADADKPDVARGLLAGEGCSISVQVLQEFVHQSTRPSRPGAITPAKAWTMVDAWRRFRVAETTLPLLASAERIQRRTLYSIWDSLIVAAALALGCAILYSEDMQDGRIIDGLRIVNPFR